MNLQDRINLIKEAIHKVQLASDLVQEALEGRNKKRILNRNLQTKKVTQNVESVEKQKQILKWSFAQPV